MRANVETKVPAWLERARERESAAPAVPAGRDPREQRARKLARRELQEAADALRSGPSRPVLTRESAEAFIAEGRDLLMAAQYEWVQRADPDEDIDCLGWAVAQLEIEPGPAALLWCEAFNAAAKVYDEQFYVFKSIAAWYATYHGAWQAGWDWGSGVYVLYHPVVGTVRIHDPYGQTNAVLAPRERSARWEQAEWTGVRLQWAMGAIILSYLDGKYGLGWDDNGRLLALRAWLSTASTPAEIRRVRRHSHGGPGAEHIETAEFRHQRETASWPETDFARLMETAFVPMAVRLNALANLVYRGVRTNGRARRPASRLFVERAK